MDNSVPKCTRVVITAMFADGSSAVVDIPQPVRYQAEVRQIDPWEFSTVRVSPSSDTEYILIVQLNKEHPRPMTLTADPVPEGPLAGVERWLKDKLEPLTEDEILQLRRRNQGR